VNVFPSCILRSKNVRKTYRSTVITIRNNRNNAIDVKNGSERKSELDI
jgi:hypothetical protein